MSKRRYECPICLGSKKYFTGSKYKDCNLCDDNGTVDERTYNLHTHEDEEEVP